MKRVLRHVCLSKCDSVHLLDYLVLSLQSSPARRDSCTQDSRMVRERTNQFNLNLSYFWPEKCIAIHFSVSERNNKTAVARRHQAEPTNSYLKWTYSALAFSYNAPGKGRMVAAARNERCLWFFLYVTSVYPFCLTELRSKSSSGEQSRPEVC